LLWTINDATAYKSRSEGLAIKAFTSCSRSFRSSVQRKNLNTPSEPNVWICHRIKALCALSQRWPLLIQPEPVIRFAMVIVNPAVVPIIPTCTMLTTRLGMCHDKKRKFEGARATIWMLLGTCFSLLL
jgi:hypothetical protein